MCERYKVQDETRRELGDAEKAEDGKERGKVDDEHYEREGG